MIAAGVGGICLLRLESFVLQPRIQNMNLYILQV